MTNRELIRLYYLRFIWWNVNLSPTAKKNSNPNSKSYDELLQDIILLFETQNAAFLALCEVDEKDVNQLENNLPYPLKIKNLAFSASKRTRFDTAIIYDTTLLSVQHNIDLVNEYRGQTIKAGQELKVTELRNNDVFIVYLCHWPSRLMGGSEQKRAKAADIIYRQATDEMKKDHLVIIMGDFNDNPHDTNIEHNLNASRCHDSARKSPNEVLYNPFWRNLISKNHYNHLTRKEDLFPSGSYRYTQTFSSHWHVYDQILVSGGFLGGKNWHLQESACGVIDSEPFSSKIANSKSLYDHFPVVCEITNPEAKKHV